MKPLHGYANTFSAIPNKGFDGEKTCRSGCAISPPDHALIESIQGGVEHASKSAAVEEAHVMGVRGLSELVSNSVPMTAQSVWSSS